MKLHRLRGRKSPAFVRKNGSLWKGKHMRAFVLAGHPKNPDLREEDALLYVGVSTTTKLHKSAVKRNRMRRRCREALRKAVALLDTCPVLQLLLIPKPTSETCNHEEIEADVENLLKIILKANPSTPRLRRAGS